ncbi:pilus assembly protein TadG-related protein [Streptomonospora nanhaiensis]|uniref:Putative membrane protein n=1 Tax=Streptomonospora nanhaiensis TaxID=1323731 RepID=A0A853BLJ5_9ACTN|nr:pilus assembly protein TadG-related protein [Streptomonospora nanhaiensis]MBV2363237.1 hypothetical protein [Streptomonospora nanhaiensis]MBX9389672.1 hypothetical protein [Streptomonospora nanhaiensis]NYI95595.1 putative membrane protein [Streptomonospora nanhaiensis]
MSARLRSSDSGQANLYLLVGLTLSLIAIMLLFVRLGNANDLRTQSQTAADAAALAAAGVAREQAAQELAEGNMPYSRLYDPAEGRSRAEQYAQVNGAILDDIRASDDSQGNLGNIVRVEVRSAECQAELEQDRTRHWANIDCGTPDHDANHTGNAAAIAEVVIPECEYGITGTEIGGLICDGVRITEINQARRAIDVRLTNSEGQYIYKPIGTVV